MISEAEQSQSRLAVLHAVVYAAGMLLFVAGLAGHTAYLLLLSGPCLALSGGLIWVGTQITLGGPVGQILRGLLGRSRVTSLHLRALFWVMVGVLITLWGMASLRAGKPQPLLLQDPTISLLHHAP